MKTMATYKRVLKLMGNRFEFTVIADKEDSGQKTIDAAIAEVSRIEALSLIWYEFVK